MPLNSILFSIVCVCVFFFSSWLHPLFKIPLQRLLGTVWGWVLACIVICQSVLTSVLKAVVLFALPLNSILFSIVCVCFSILVVSLFEIPLQHLLGTVWGWVLAYIYSTTMLGLSDVMQRYLRPIPFMEVQRFIAH